MKRITYICVILLCSIGFAFAQGAKPGRTNTNSKKVVKKTAVSPFTEAEKAWTPFWIEFKRAIKNHDKNAFREIISNEYYDGGRCEENSFVDKRERFFCSDQNEWWKSFDWIFGKRLKIDKISKYDGEITRGVSVTARDGISGIGASFKYEKDRKWYFVSVGSFGA